MGDTIRFTLEKAFRWQGDLGLERRRPCGSPTRLSIDASWGASERLMPGPASREGAVSALGSLFLQGSPLGGTVAIQVRSLETEEDAPAVIGQTCVLREEGGESSQATPQKVTDRVPRSPNHLDTHPREMKTCLQKKKNLSTNVHAELFRIAQK